MTIKKTIRGSTRFRRKVLQATLKHAYALGYERGFYNKSYVNPYDFGTEPHKHFQTGYIEGLKPFTSYRPRKECQGLSLKIIKTLAYILFFLIIICVTAINVIEL
jgi:hypothetical protein